MEDLKLKNTLGNIPGAIEKAINKNKTSALNRFIPDLGDLLDKMWQGRNFLRSPEGKKAEEYLHERLKVLMEFIEAEEHISFKDVPKIKIVFTLTGDTKAVYEKSTIKVDFPKDFDYSNSEETHAIDDILLHELGHHYQEGNGYFIPSPQNTGEDLVVKQAQAEGFARCFELVMGIKYSLKIKSPEQKKMYILGLLPFLNADTLFWNEFQKIQFPSDIDRGVNTDVEALIEHMLVYYPESLVISIANSAKRRIMQIAQGDKRIFTQINDRYQFATELGLLFYLPEMVVERLKPDGHPRSINEVLSQANTFQRMKDFLK